MIIWDERLISRARAADLCGNWAVKLDYPFLRCGVCDGNITKLPGEGKLFNLDVLISAAVRHMCMSHDYYLSGVSNEDKGRDCGAIDSASSGRSGIRAADPVR
jgi:hypothetical protein